jgi:hypothetical protein
VEFGEYYAERDVVCHLSALVVQHVLVQAMYHHGG